MNIKKVIITGGCGFVGHHLVEHLIKNTDWQIIIFDKLNYASMGLSRIKDNQTYFNDRVSFYSVDLSIPLSDGIIKEVGDDVDIIYHLAAESHVDNSIKDPITFFENNIIGTANLLEYARKLRNLKLFFYFSTDEVFGPAKFEHAFEEWDGHRPTNPYSASKSSAESISLSYANTYNIPLMIVNNMNIFGERQHVEKFIPSTIKKVLNNEKVLIHSYKNKKKSGSRFYIHARNVCESLLFLIQNGKIGEKYHIVGEKEVDNLELANLIAKYIGKDLKYEMIDFHSSRPGHDLRYALKDTNLKKLGWNIPRNFEESLEKTVKWTLNNLKWLNEIK